MPIINVNVTDEELKAVNGIVVDAKVWLQDAWNGKAASCIKRVLFSESNLNPGKMNNQEKSDWIRDNTFPTRVEKDAANAAGAAGGSPPTPPGPPTP